MPHFLSNIAMRQFLNLIKMKKLAMLFLMLFAVALFVQASGTPDWLVYFGPEGLEIYDDGCKGAITVVNGYTGDVFNSAGPC